MPNIKNTIDSNNRKIINKEATEKDTNTKTCNCKQKNQCPLNGSCLKNNLIYQATVTTGTDTQTYIGLTANIFKTRYNAHMSSFRNNKQKHATELSKFIWHLKDSNKIFNISWKILKHATSYKNTTKRCNLCLTEKFYILTKPQLASLNRRSELMGTCRHARKFLLSCLNKISSNSNHITA